MSHRADAADDLRGNAGIEHRHHKKLLGAETLYQTAQAGEHRGAMSVSSRLQLI
jgi:hypothetical protein